MDADASQTWVSLKQLPPEVLDAIRDKLVHFTAFLFRVEDGRPSRGHVGAATCVAAAGGYYLLTAAHVWAVLQGGSFALALGEDRLLIEVPHQSVRATVLSGGGSEEWGPDLALLRLPEPIARDVRQVKAFYDLARPERTPPPAPGWQPVALWAILGAAAEKTTFLPTGAAVLKINLFDSWNVKTHQRNELDYHDLTLDPDRRPNLPVSYGGVSGSGLWRILIMESEDSACWTGAVQLTGVAFYEGPPPRRFIRSHGHDSLYRELLGGVVEQGVRADEVRDG